LPECDSLACVTPLPVLRAAEADEENRNALDRKKRKDKGKLRPNSDVGDFGVVRWGAAIARPIADATDVGGRGIGFSRCKQNQ
jgi:hypothetical protein